MTTLGRTVSKLMDLTLAHAVYSNYSMCGKKRNNIQKMPFHNTLYLKCLSGWFLFIFSWFAFVYVHPFVCIYMLVPVLCVCAYILGGVSVSCVGVVWWCDCGHVQGFPSRGDGEGVPPLRPEYLAVPHPPPQDFVCPTPQNFQIYTYIHSVQPPPHIIVVEYPPIGVGLPPSLASLMGNLLYIVR